MTKITVLVRSGRFWQHLLTGSGQTRLFRITNYKNSKSSRENESNDIHLWSISTKFNEMVKIVNHWCKDGHF